MSPKPLQLGGMCRAGHELLQAKEQFKHSANFDLFFAALHGEDNIYNQWAELKLRGPKYAGPVEFPDAVVGYRYGKEIKPGGAIILDNEKQKEMWRVGRVTSRQHARQLPELGGYHQTVRAPNVGKLPGETRITTRTTTGATNAN